MHIARPRCRWPPIWGPKVIRGSVESFRSSSRPQKCTSHLGFSLGRGHSRRLPGGAVQRVLCRRGQGEDLQVHPTLDPVDDDDESVKLTFGNMPARVTAGTTGESTVNIPGDDDRNDPLVTPTCTGEGVVRRADMTVGHFRNSGGTGSGTGYSDSTAADGGGLSLRMSPANDRIFNPRAFHIGDYSFRFPDRAPTTATASWNGGRREGNSPRARTSSSPPVVIPGSGGEAGSGGTPWAQTRRAVRCCIINGDAGCPDDLEEASFTPSGAGLAGASERHGGLENSAQPANTPACSAAAARTGTASCGSPDPARTRSRQATAWYSTATVTRRRPTSWGIAAATPSAASCTASSRTLDPSGFDVFGAGSTLHIDEQPSGSKTPVSRPSQIQPGLAFPGHGGDRGALCIQHTGRLRISKDTTGLHVQHGSLTGLGRRPE